MPSIAETIRRLQTSQPPSLRPAAGVQHGRVTSLTLTGSNPGALKGWYHVPAADDPMPLVVVLHGCTQTAAAYDHGSGWSQLADRHRFAVLFPEQQRGNNANLCFNWFLQEDTKRGAGELGSIREMIDQLTGEVPIDPARIFVTGLSAGGAMASALLAAYPDVFAGGSIIAGLPYGGAASVPQALSHMRGQGHPDEATYARKLRAASSHQGSWPRITVWHGDADVTVSPINAKAIIAQWRGAHGASLAPDRTDIVSGHRRQTWLGRDGRAAIEYYQIAGMGHGTPVQASGEGSGGVPGPHMLEAGISSSWQMASEWGLLRAEAADASGERAPAAPSPDAPAFQFMPPAGSEMASGIQATIESALRKAGLLK